MVWASAASGEYPVFVGRGVLALAGALPGLDGRGFCVTDETVGRAPSRRGADARRCRAWSRSRPARSTRRWRPPSASGARWSPQGVTRADHLVALGGGVVGDLAGFCAATYQRGDPVVQVPTTLVAQVDSAYGGKTGVDLPEAKNYVGAYHQPAAVLADTATLGHAPARGARGRLRRGRQDRADRRRRAVGHASPPAVRSTTTSSWPARARSSRSSPPTSATAAAARCSTSATPSATRSRPSRATARCATARRSGSACSPRCG